MPRPCVTGEAKGRMRNERTQLDSHGPVEPHARHVTADGRVAFKAPVGALIFTNTILPHHLPLAQVYTTDAFNPDDS